MSNHGKMMHAKDIGRKFAESEVKIEKLQKEIEEYDN